MIMYETTEPSSDSQSSIVQNTDDNAKLTCHFIKLPKIILTRIDEGKSPLTNNSRNLLKKRIKKVENNKKISKVSNSSNVDSKSHARPKGRAKKEDLGGKKTFPNAHKTMVKSKVGTVSKKLKKSKEDPKPKNNVVKNMLKKTMLQKRSKIVIPHAKKTKLSSNKSITKKTKKPIPPKIKLDVPHTQTIGTESSEDEFLYDELIEELEKSSMNQSGSIKPLFEKTTNITLKPNAGNKLPTIVKGGIIKKTSLPADLKPIATLNGNNSQETEILFTPSTKKSSGKSTTKSPKPSDRPSAQKRPSPWPVSISSSKKTTPVPSPNKIKKKNPKTSISNNVANIRGAKKKASSVDLRTLFNETPLPDSSANKSKPISHQVSKPKIGPKQTAKVEPLSKSSTQEDNLSDEYTEEETLENIDSDPVNLLSKGTDDLIQNNKPEQETRDTKTPLKSTLSSFEISKDDEDPHLDLLRILTDDSDDPIPLHTQESNKDNDGQSEKNSCNEIENQNLSEVNSSSDSGQITEDTQEANEEPQVRTIYEVMAEISVHYPSWNLHIIPETNAFCIAQVTKGRLGLPTLKKCIELDPVDYNAKVYIHQYHIKRFDGIYESEESIIALIQEINAIKA